MLGSQPSEAPKREIRIAMVAAPQDLYANYVLFKSKYHQLYHKYEMAIGTWDYEVRKVQHFP